MAPETIISLASALLQKHPEAEVKSTTEGLRSQETGYLTRIILKPTCTLKKSILPWNYHRAFGYVFYLTVTYWLFPTFLLNFKLFLSQKVFTNLYLMFRKQHILF